MLFICVFLRTSDVEDRFSMFVGFWNYFLVKFCFVFVLKIGLSFSWWFRMVFSLSFLKIFCTCTFGHVHWEYPSYSVACIFILRTQLFKEVQFAVFIFVLFKKSSSASKSWWHSPVISQLYCSKLHCLGLEHTFFFLLFHGLWMDAIDWLILTLTVVVIENKWYRWWWKMVL